MERESDRDDGYRCLIMGKQKGRRESGGDCGGESDKSEKRHCCVKTK